LNASKTCQAALAASVTAFSTYLIGLCMFSYELLSNPGSISVKKLR